MLRQSFPRRGGLWWRWVGLWGLFTLVIPRVATEVSIGVQLIAESYRAGALLGEIGAALEDGIDGKMNRDTAVEAIIGDLMVGARPRHIPGCCTGGSDVQGIELRAEAKWEDMIADHFVIEFEDQKSQKRRNAWLPMQAYSPLIRRCAHYPRRWSWAAPITRTTDTSPTELRRGGKC